MDFVKLLRSFEEFLYEILTWLLFYPRTLWRVLRHPLAMMRYSDGEQNDAPENQYRAALSPPLFLMISIIVAHLLELGAHDSAALSKGFRGIFQTDQTFLLLRCVVFGLYPLAFAAALIRRKGEPLDRNSLRAPFFAQCYVSAPFALMLSAAGIGGRMTDPLVVAASGLLLAAAVAWFLSLQTQWFRDRLGMSLARAFGMALGLWGITTLVIAALGTVQVI
jgi:hypothetical protein